MKKVVIDIWGGEMSQLHLARFIRTIEESLIVAHRELEAGYLVNLRADTNLEGFYDFDKRS